MDNVSSNTLSAYLISPSRNKIVFYKENIPEIPAINLGFLLAQTIFNIADVNKFPMKVSNVLYEILKTSLFHHNHFGKMLAISNIGILLERDLKQDFIRILENHSNSNVLFVKWEGEIDNDYLYFLSKEKGIKTNIKHLSHIVI